MKQNFGVPLSRNEMKNVMGGTMPEDHTCCAHYNTGCGDVGGPASCCGGGSLTMQEAKAKASSMAQEPGSGGASWCCSSCNSLC